MNERDSELMDRVRAGDHDAFRELAERYEHRVKTYINRLIRSDDRADDLTQETFLRLYNHALRHGGDGQGEQPTIAKLLLCIASHLAIDSTRREKARRRALLQLAINGVEPPEEADARVLGGELQQKLNAAMAKLPPAYREAARLHFFCECTYSEMASELGISMGTVKSRISRARELLINQLGDYLKRSRP
jgi:RNA polymerase sigma-70 factor (ECF subfamily)